MTCIGQFLAQQIYDRPANTLLVSLVVDSKDATHFQIGPDSVICIFLANFFEFLLFYYSFVFTDSQLLSFQDKFSPKIDKLLSQ
jgi:hypothetical protein